MSSSLMVIGYRFLKKGKLPKAFRSFNIERYTQVMPAMLLGMALIHVAEL